MHPFHSVRQLSLAFIQFIQLCSSCQTPYSQPPRGDGFTRIHAACNKREDGHQPSHPFGISCVIFHWQWKTALESFWDSALTVGGILVLHSLATAASTYIMNLLCSFSVFPHSIVCSQLNQQEINVICDVMYLPATSSMSDGRIFCWQAVYATERRISGLRKTMHVSSLLLLAVVLVIYLLTFALLFLLLLTHSHFHSYFAHTNQYFSFKSMKADFAYYRVSWIPENTTAA